MSSAGAEAIIQARNLCKTYASGEVKVEVLNDINLDIAAAEFLTIMGPSGSGKSTLLYLMGALDRPTSGTLTVNGRDLAAMKDPEQSLLRRRDIGFVFQFFNLVPNLNLEDNVMLPVLLDGKNLRHARKRLDEILELVGLAGRRRHTPRELSGGEQQRVAIARALVNDPEIVLADEPTGNLDSKTGTDIMELLKRINETRGKTIVQVTHSQEAASYGHRVIHLRDGRIWE